MISEIQVLYNVITNLIFYLNSCFYGLQIHCFASFVFLICSFPIVAQINFAKLSQAMGFQRSPSSKQKVKPISKENNDESGGDHSINARTTSNPPDSDTSDASYNSWMVGFH